MKSRTLSALGLVFLHAAVSTAPCQTTRLPFDLAKTPIAISSMPKDFVDLNGKCIFTAITVATGRELFVMTAAGGVKLLKDIWPGREGSRPTELIRCGNFVFFAANDGKNGRELWVTNGTERGTRLVADIEKGEGSSSPEQLVCCDGKVWFSAVDCLVGRELRVSDGTAAGTKLVEDKRKGLASSMGPGPIVCCGKEVYFFADDGTTGFELWKSDGTEPGTKLIKDLVPGRFNGVQTSTLVCCKGKVFFIGLPSSTGSELYVSDGTEAGTTIVIDLFPGSSGPRHLICCNDLLYFSAFAQIGTTRVGQEPFVSDGTAAGTVLLKDVRPGSASSFASQFTCCDGKVFFTANGPQGTELWVTTGRPNGTRLVKDILTGPSGSSPSALTCCGGKLFFLARTIAAGRELWISDGTGNGTRIVKNFAPGSASISLRAIGCCGGRLVFTALGDGIGFELFASDGTANGTKLLADIEKLKRTVSADVRNITCAGTAGIFFTAKDPLIGNELFFWNGLNVLAFDIFKGERGSNPAFLTWNGSVLGFAGTALGIGREFFIAKTDGTFKVVKDQAKGEKSANPSKITALADGRFVYKVTTPETGSEVGVVDGDVATILELIKGAKGSFPDWEINLDGLGIVTMPDVEKLVFVADTGKGRKAVELASDNTVRGLDLSDTGGAGLAGNSLQLPGVALINGFDKDRKRAAWSVDVATGKEKFKTELKVSGNSAAIREAQFDALNADRWIVSASEIASTSDGDQLFELNPNGLKLIKNINPDGPDFIRDLTPFGNLMFFRANDGKHGPELFCLDLKTDKVKLFDVLAGEEGSLPRAFKIIGCRLWFLAQGSDSSDVDVYSTDGKTVRKEADNDSSLDQNTRAASEIVCCCNEVWFPGYTHKTGVELRVRTRPGPTAEIVGAPSGPTNPVMRSTAPVIGGTMTWRGARGPEGHVGAIYLDPVVRKKPFSVFGRDFWFHVNTAIFVTSTTGPTYSITVRIPNDKSLEGVKALCQTVWLPSSFLPLATTNAVLLGFGSCD